MTYKKTIKIPKEAITHLTKILKRKTAHPDYKSGDVIATYTIGFQLPDGKRFEVDIKVCNGDSPYVDPVLFEIIDNIRNEVCVGEVSDSLIGEYHFDIEEGAFIVNVESM